MMRAPDFWRRAPPSPLARALAPLGALYGAAVARRMRRAGPRADRPTIVVGGLTLGGDGKTPTALALAALLAEMGERPAFLTRGYGRRGAGAAFRVDPDRDTARTAGDEALLLARSAPTIVGTDRAAGARLAQALGASVLILDDGLHSRRLEADFALLVVDGRYGAGNGYCPPAGPLRAPLSAQLAAADALLAIGRGAAGAPVVAWAQAAGRPVFHASLALDSPEALAGRRALAFAGIARPDKFFATLEDAGVALAATRGFADHHEFSAREIAALEREAARLGADLLTTEKDAARLGAGLPARVTVARAMLVIDESERLAATLRHILA